MLTNYRLLEFADFRIDVAERVLYKADLPVPLAPKVFDTLFALVSRSGRVVSKETMMEEIWKDTFVEENNLTQYIFTLRRVLGDAGGGTKYIETVPRRGYRFLPEVLVVGPDEESRRPADHTLRREGFAPAAILPEAITNGTYARSKSEEAETPNTPKAFATESHVSHKRSSRAVLILGFAVLALLGSLGFALQSGWESMGTKQVDLRRLTEKGNLTGAAISPDGKSFAYVERDDKLSTLRLKNIQTNSEVIVVPLTDEELGSPRFSPDGNYIYFSRGESIFRMPVFGGERLKIASNIWSNFSISPDGTTIAFPRGHPTEKKSSIVVASTDGSGEERVLSTTDSPAYFEAWGPAPAFAPDGESVTVAMGSHGTEWKTIVEIGLKSGDMRELKTEAVWGTIEYLDWRKAEELLVAAQRKGDHKAQIWSVHFPDGSVERVTNDFNDYLSFTLSGDRNRLIAIQETEDLHLWVFDTETGAGRPITSGASRAEGRYGLSFAPDQRIIFTARHENNYDIYSIDADGGDLRQLTKDTGRLNIDPVVAPDNRNIVFTSDRTGHLRLWKMATDGTSASQLTRTSDIQEDTENAPYFSPDGKWVYYVFYQAGKGSIRKISIDGGESIAVTQTDKNVFEPVPSPDGKFIAHAVYNNDAKIPWQIGVHSLVDAESPDRFFNLPSYRLRVRWSLDSSSVIGVDDRSFIHNLVKTNLTSGAQQQITHFTSEKIHRFDVSPDRRFYALARGNYFYDTVLIER
ncbi:MAG: PD40 domain-containing protein [Blastocatellia bacterium]|nr:PD40 domain-containing protein [Blastocatellia bacterium]